MTNKPNIDIEVNDEQFKRFMDRFSVYSDKLDEMPDSWKKLDAAMSGTGAAFGKVAGRSSEAMAIGAAAAAVITEEIHKATKAQHQFRQATNQSHSALKMLAATTGSIGKTIFGISKSMLKIGTIGGSLFGIGSTLGIDALAGTALNKQKTARGLGISVGQMQAFRANMGRYVNPDSLLSNAAAARNDQTKWGAFAAMGIPVQQALSEGTMPLAMQLTNRARSIWQHGPHTLQYANARGLTQFFSLDDLRRLGRSSTAGLTSAESSTLRDASKFGFGPAVNREWAMLSIQLQKAGIVIEKSLIEGLAPLAPKLETLSRDISGFISTFLQGPDFKALMKDFAAGLGEFTHYLASPQFKSDIRSVVSDFEFAAKKMGDVLRWLGLLPSAPTEKKGTHPGAPNMVPGINTLPGSPQYYRSHGVTGPGGIQQLDKWKKAAQILPLPKVLKTEVVDALANHVPIAFARAIFKEEGGLNPDGTARISPAGGIGAGQLMPATAKGLGPDAEQANRGLGIGPRPVLA